MTDYSLLQASLNFFHFQTNIFPHPPSHPQDFWAIWIVFAKEFLEQFFQKDFQNTFSLEPLRATNINSYLTGGKSLTSYSPDCRTSVSRASFPVQGRSARPTGSFRSCASARNARSLDDGRLSFAVKREQRLTLVKGAWTGGDKRETCWRKIGNQEKKKKKRGERSSKHDTQRRIANGIDRTFNGE